MSKKRENEIHFGKDARLALKQGVDLVANAVKVTYGAKGRNVLISNSSGFPPHITKDGVTVAKSVEVDDALVRQGALLIQSASESANRIAGDGSTLTTILTQALVNNGFESVDRLRNVNVTDVKRGMDYAKEEIVKIIEGHAVKVESVGEIKNVATISANNDPVIGGYIAEAFEKVGKHGVVSFDNSETHQSYVEFVDGYQFDRGLITPYLITDAERLRSVMDNPYIIITDYVISSASVFENIVNKILEANRENNENRGLVIICDDMEFQCVQLFLKNHAQGIIKVCVVKAPEFGDRRYDMLQDMCIVTGATFVSKEKGDSFETLELDDLGEATSVVADLENTTIIGGQGSVEAITKRAEDIKALMDNKKGYALEVYEKRLGKLTGGAAVIKLGATSEVNLREMKDRVEDAISAVKASIEEGVLPGGASFLYRIGAGIYNLQVPENTTSVAFKLGLDIVKKSLVIPFLTLLENAGYIIGEEVNDPVENLKNNDDIGFNVLTGEFVNMFEAGIIDPAKVIRLATENAIDTVSTMLLTEAIVLGADEKGKGLSNFDL